MYDYAAGSIKKGKEVQRGRDSLPWPCACCDFGNAAPTFSVPPRCGLQPEPGLFFLLSPARNFSPRSTLKKKKKEEATAPQHEEPGQNASEGNMELVSDLCLLLLILHAPAVLALSTRKLRAVAPRWQPGRGSARVLAAMRGPQTCFSQVSRCPAVPAVGSNGQTSANCDFNHGARERVCFN